MFVSLEISQSAINVKFRHYRARGPGGPSRVKVSWGGLRRCWQRNTDGTGGKNRGRPLKLVSAACQLSSKGTRVDVGFVEDENPQRIAEENGVLRATQHIL